MTAEPTAVALPATRPLVVLWRFSRPHTIVGTTLSIVCLWLLVAAELPAVAVGEGVGYLLATVLAGACVNVFIVGLNQLEDVEIDRINKPHLPIAAGDLSVPAARAIVAVAGVVPVALALTQGPAELIFVLIGLGVGVAYSSPPLRLKRWPLLAAISISGVRSVVVNVGVALHFATSLGGEETVVEPAWALTLFVIPFSLAIALLKDVPDIEGDRRYAIATFSVRLGPRRVLRLGLAALAVAYLGMAVLGPLLCQGASPVVLVVGHLVPLALVLAWAARTDVADRAAFTRFYLRVWGLFFLEYLVAAAAWLTG
ncbi:MAG: homogentisate phytyltransferase [Solirubrobacterales bacterium]|nr:homogentisate phytyltransferase [Solirubrobacterales bacterium]